MRGEASPLGLAMEGLCSLVELQASQSGIPQHIEHNLEAATTGLEQLIDSSYEPFASKHSPWQHQPACPSAWFR